jgi:hypothetical protein
MTDVTEMTKNQAAAFRFPPEGDVRADLRDRYGYGGQLADIYVGMKGPLVHKWHHYLPLYERYFGPWRNKPVRFLEIGVSRGGSLKMWRQWLGKRATLYGIDIDPRCARFDGRAGCVRIGSQDDPGFLASVVDEMGGVDVVLDDGSHQMAHIRASLSVLFPRLSVGGIYVIEDLQTAYRPEFGGGLNASGNFFNTVRDLIDDIHKWHHTGEPRLPALAGFVAGVHVHDGLVVIDKAEVVRPTHSRVGGGKPAEAPAAAPGLRERRRLRRKALPARGSSE